MAQLPKGSVVLTCGYKIRYATNNIFYPFHQNTDFWYLTGFNEPDAAMILEKTDCPRGFKQTMFVNPKNEQAELWDGPRTGVEGVKELFGADEAYDNTQFSAHLHKILQAKHVYMDKPSEIPTLLDAHSSLTAAGHKLNTIQPLGKLVQELRLIKSDAEIELMRTSGRVSSKAFVQSMKWTEPGLGEAQLWAKLEYECRMRGSSALAYVPVVAGGSNALSMHYVRNDMLLKDGDLVLVDAGGEYHGYASDITRTWPVNGKFTDAQRDLYQVVLNVNKACIKLCTETSGQSLNGIHNESVRIMRQELKNIAFPLNHWDLERVLYPHHVGHYLGLDVHDVYDITRSRKLQKNMVVTIEPGLYVPYDDRFPKHFQGIGIRIEDNVVIGTSDPFVLTANAPKEIIDVEACCQKILD
ncbi:hypothetical protein DM01DRAFT_1338059 [Hesseltinella vesiculosa]|uniref:Aminopeptidase P N-terminal domain-containing protein n=1 Tax=Hesseltinella vesiculosa TaxID=101127 RepID=A0A1X2GBL9_9FUNG|nr:hypothetical protein DM01DRAFT_1338059 [Hesseltinella vesiculosa]